jgi:catechol 2,3-dioxygenase-like lactoylglutathione lyase family enzyme
MITPVRRVTVPTARTDECIRFYQEVLGLRVFYDGTMSNAPGVRSLLGPEGRYPQRVVSLQQGNQENGMVGLLEYVGSDFKVHPLERPKDGPFPVAVNFQVGDLLEVEKRARRMNARVVAGPVKKVIPGKGTWHAMSFLDPNGVLVMVVEENGLNALAGSPIRSVSVPLEAGRLEATQRYWKETLDLKVIADETHTSQPGDSILGFAGRVITRTVSLGHQAGQNGLVSFTVYREPAVKVPSFVKRDSYPYELIYVFRIEDMDRTLNAALANGGKLMGRREYEIPMRGMVEGAMVTDPNGIVLDLTRFIG